MRNFVSIANKTFPSKHGETTVVTKLPATKTPVDKQFKR